MGTKPTNEKAIKPTVMIVRSFRGSMLFLASVASNSGMRWINDSAKALKLTIDEARLVAERASREWGTECALMDKDGSTPALKVEPAISYIPTSADDVRAMLAQFVEHHNSGEKSFDHKEFLAEMDRRAKLKGHKFTPAQYKLMAQIVKAYMAELS